MYGRVTFITLLILCGVTVLMAGAVAAQDEVAVETPVVESPAPEYQGKPISLDVQDYSLSLVVRQLVQGTAQSA